MYEGFYSKTKRLKVCGTRGGLLSNVAYGICGRKWTIREKSERLGNKMMRVSAGSQYGSLTSPTYFRIVTSVTILLCFHAVYILVIACNRAARPNRDLKSPVRESRAY